MALEYCGIMNQDENNETRDSSTLQLKCGSAASPIDRHIDAQQQTSKEDDTGPGKQTIRHGISSGP